MKQTAIVPMKRVWDSVKLYSVMCKECSKWRLIPIDQREIRGNKETFNENSFTCARAREWRPQISCEDPTDITEPDNRYCWAMDKPNIPRTSPGWQRLVRMRAQGGTRFADVYYVAPSNKQMSSVVELDKFFHKYPKFLQGGKINISHFSFQVPVPLNKNYVSKRRSRAPAASCSHNMYIGSQSNLWIVQYEAPESVSTEAPAPDLAPAPAPAES